MTIKYSVITVAKHRYHEVMSGENSNTEIFPTPGFLPVTCDNSLVNFRLGPGAPSFTEYRTSLKGFTPRMVVVEMFGAFDGSPKLNLPTAD